MKFPIALRYSAAAPADGEAVPDDDLYGRQPPASRLGAGLMKISASSARGRSPRLAEAVSVIRPYVESLHVDVMDGRFAPAFGFGERLVDSLVADGGLPIDVHLMVERPEDWAVRFAKLGARSVAFHIEAAEEPVLLAKAVRAAGALAHLALLPKTQPSHIPGGGDASDGVLLLTAPAGGGEFYAGALDRVRSLSPHRFPSSMAGSTRSISIARGEWRGACGHRCRTIRRKRPRRTRKTPRRPPRGTRYRLGSVGMRGAAITWGSKLPELFFHLPILIPMHSVAA